MNSFFDEEELRQQGFKSVGCNVLVSRKASFYSTDNMEIGNYVRIDDFCFLSGKIILGNYIHIATGCILYGSTKGIIMEDFSAISPRSVVHADSDDYSGNSLTNPMVDIEYRNVTFATVYVRKHAIIGSGCTILPGVDIGEGCAIGAMSLVRSSTRPWTINYGVPCREIKERSRHILDLEQQFLAEVNTE